MKTDSKLARKYGFKMHYEQRPEKFMTDQRPRALCGSVGGGFMTRRMKSVTCQRCRSSVFGTGISITLRYR